MELLRNLMKCELSLSLSNDWRLHSALLNQLECCAKTLPSDLIYSNVPVVLFHRIQDAVSSKIIKKFELSCHKLSQTFSFLLFS